MARSSKMPSGNVLVDLGFPDAEELAAKTALALRLNEILERCGLTQLEAAWAIGITQAEFSALRNYRLRGISRERLAQALVALDRNGVGDAPSAGLKVATNKPGSLVRR